MKKAAVLLIAVLTVLFGGCTVYEISEATTSEPAGDGNTTVVVVATPETTENTTAQEQTSADEETSCEEQTTATQEATSSEQTTVREEKTTKEEKTTREEKTTKEERTTREVKTTAGVSDEVELNISMPEKNGTMKTDASPDNKYIRIVNKQKKIDKSLLLAVYSVPDSGQNYVFEFYTDGNTAADNIRRVYLIDAYGDITSIAAAENSERVNISPVENWFCMNVLIKEIIYPAVSGNK